MTPENQMKNSDETFARCLQILKDHGLDEAGREKAIKRMKKQRIQRVVIAVIVFTLLACALFLDIAIIVKILTM